MLSLRARLVFPVDQPPIDGGYVTVDGPRIVAVGRTPAGGPVQDLGDVALLPGLVNAHTHLEYSLLEQPLGRPGMPFPDWIRTVIAHKRQQPVEKGGQAPRDTPEPQKSPDSLGASPPLSTGKQAGGPAAAAIAAGLRESLANGVTTLGEIASPGWPVEPFQAYPGAATVFQELIGLNKDKNPLPSWERVAAQPPGEGVGEESNDGGLRLRFGLSPHAPYSVHPELLVRAVALARETQAPLAMHLAESREELELLRTGGGPFRDLLMELGVWNAEVFPAGRRPLDYLRVLADAPRSLVIHGNYLNDEEIRFVAERADRMAVVYCPRTHAYFGHDAHPLPRLLSTGALVALGTDGRGSNPDLSLLAEMRHVARHFPEIPPDMILRLGTLNAARALGLDRQAGSLTPGKWADIVAVPISPPGSQRSSQCCWLESDQDVSWRMVRGADLN